MERPYRSQKSEGLTSCKTPGLKVFFVNRIWYQLSMIDGQQMELLLSLVSTADSTNVKFNFSNYYSLF